MTTKYTIKLKDGKSSLIREYIQQHPSFQDGVIVVPPDYKKIAIKEEMTNNIFPRSVATSPFTPEKIAAIIEQQRNKSS